MQGKTNFHHPTRRTPDRRSTCDLTHLYPRDVTHLSPPLPRCLLGNFGEHDVGDWATYISCRVVTLPNKFKALVWVLQGWALLWNLSCNVKRCCVIYSRRAKGSLSSMFRLCIYQDRWIHRAAKMKIGPWTNEPVEAFILVLSTVQGVVEADPGFHAAKKNCHNSI